MGEKPCCHFFQPTSGNRLKLSLFIHNCMTYQLNFEYKYYKEAMIL